jgi:hypothetical protein
MHTVYSCANCKEAGHSDTAHAAYSTRCPVKTTTVREAWQKSRTAPTLPSTNPNDDTNMITDA